MPPNVSRFDRFRKEAPGAGMEAPDFTARLLDGGEVQLSSLGGQVVVLEFGAIT